MMNSQRIKAVFLDLDDTLYPYTPCNTAGICALFQFLHQHLAISKRSIAAAFDTARADVKVVLKRNLGFESAASHSRLLYIQRTLEILTGKSHPTLALQGEKKFWDTYLRTMKLFTHARAFLTHLQRQRIRVVIVTDLTHAIQLQKIQTLGIEKFVDLVVSSEEVGMDKPNTEQFRHALQKIKLNPHNVVHVGDSEKKDASGCRTAGIIPILIHNRPTASNILFVKNFKDLQRLFPV